MAGSMYTALFGTGADVGNSKLGSVTFGEGAVITTGTTSGLTIGGNNNQKVGEYGATPVVQPSGTGELIGLNGNAATAANAANMNSNGNNGSTNYSFNDLVKALKAAGILKA